MRSGRLAHPLFLAGVATPELILPKSITPELVSPELVTPELVQEIEEARIQPEEIIAATEEPVPAMANLLRLAAISESSFARVS